MQVGDLQHEYLKWEVKSFEASTIKINENFSNKYHQMQKVHNNYFWSKQCNTTLHQMKISKHVCNKIAATYRTEENVNI